MSLEADRAALLLRNLAQTLSEKAPASPYCAQLVKDARRAAAQLEGAQRAPVRFFARIYAAVLECPRCGKVYEIGTKRPKGRLVGTAGDHWDPVTAQLRCMHCRLVVVLGLIAWPYTSRQVGSQGAPEDQVPDDRQRAQMRELARGYWVAEGVKRRPRNTNVRMMEECTCPPGAEGSGEGCPVHRKAK